jgi:hypothetical protein
MALPQPETEATHAPITLTTITKMHASSRPEGC